MKIKKIFVLAISSVLIASLVNNSFADIGIKINNKEIQSDAETKIIDGRTMVPVRAIFEGVGSSVEWDSQTKTIIGNRGSTVVVMKIGEKSITINNKSINMDAAAMIIDERTYAPARYVAEAFGFDVNWNAELKEVLINDKVLSNSAVETTTTTKTELTTETTTKTINKTTTEAITETTTMSAADILNSSPVEGVGASTYKLVKNDILNAFKVYYIGNFDNNNRFQRSTYNKLMEVWNSAAETKEEKEFITYSKQVYQNMVTTCKKIDQRKAKYPANTNIATYCTDRKDKLEVLLKDYLASENIEAVKKNSEKIKSFAADTIAN